MSLPFGEGPMQIGEVSERQLVSAWVVASTCSPAAELEAVLAVPVDVVARRRAELGARVRGVELAPMHGYDWTRERIDAFVAGVSDGRAAEVTLTEPTGTGSLLASWPAEGGTYWRAWERHPHRHDLWREVGEQNMQAVAPAPLAVAAGAPGLVAPGALAVVSAVADGVAQRAAVALSTAPVLAAPAFDRVTCAVCGISIAPSEVARGDGRRWAHFACAKVNTGAWGDSQGDRVRLLRKGVGQRQRDLVGVFGTQARVSLVELGKSEATQAELEALARHLDVSIDVVLGKALPRRAYVRASATPEDEREDDHGGGPDWTREDEPEPEPAEAWEH